MPSTATTQRSDCSAGRRGKARYAAAEKKLKENMAVEKAVREEVAAARAGNFAPAREK